MKSIIPKSSEYYKFSNHFMGNRSYLIRLSQPTTKLLILLQEIISVTFHLYPMIYKSSVNYV